MTREITEYQDKAREQLSFRVEGMDCASCVGKIEKACLLYTSDAADE